MEHFISNFRLAIGLTAAFAASHSAFAAVDNACAQGSAKKAWDAGNTQGKTLTHWKHTLRLPTGKSILPDHHQSCYEFRQNPGQALELACCQKAFDIQYAENEKKLAPGVWGMNGESKDPLKNALYTGKIQGDYNCPWNELESCPFEQAESETKFWGAVSIGIIEAMKCKFAPKPVAKSKSPSDPPNNTPDGGIAASPKVDPVGGSGPSGGRGAASAKTVGGKVE